MKKFFNLLTKLTIISLISVFLISLNVYAKEGEEKAGGGTEAGSGDFTWFEKEYKEVLDGSKIPVPKGSTDAGGILEGVVLKGLKYVRYVTVIIGILYLTILGYTLVVAGGNEEDVTKAKKGIIYTLIAFLMISMAEDVSEIFRMGSNKQLLTKEGVQSKLAIFDFQVGLFLTFIYYIIGGYAAIMMVRSATKLITSGGNEEVVSKHKKGLMYSILGLLLIYVGDIFIKKVFYVTNVYDYAFDSSSTKAIRVDLTEGVRQLAGITNFLVQFIGPLAVLALMIGSVMYATAGGDEEKMNKAKRLLIATVIGMLIIYGAFAIVSTFIASDFQQIDVPLQ